MDKSLSEMTLHITEQHEGAGRTEVTMSKKLYDELEKRTRAQSEESEFMVLLLGKDGIATEMIDIGIPFNEGVLTKGLEGQIISLVKPFIDNGMQIVAGYHNHPPSVVADYSGERFPQPYALCPSPGDLQTAMSVQAEIARRIGQANYPQLIGGILQSGFAINGFAVNRRMTPSEEEMLYPPDLEIPGSTISSDIRFNGKPVFEEISYYTDAKKVYNTGCFTFVPIFTGDALYAEEIPNPLAMVLETTS